MKFNKKWTVLGVLLIATVAFAAKFSENTLIIGKGTVAEDTTIISNQPGANDPFHKYNSTTGKWEFSNDGVNVKNLGSGSGGASGVNVLAENNFDFEAGVDSWTASGGVAVAETTAPLFGLQSGSWTANALAQTFDSVLAPITAGFVNGQCQAEIKYIYAAGANGDYKMVVRQFDDSAATEITVGEIALDVTASQRPAQLFFTCPDDVADTLRIRIESTIVGPGPIILDDAFVGTGKNTFFIANEKYARFSCSGSAASNTDTFCASMVGDDDPFNTVVSNTFVAPETGTWEMTAKAAFANSSTAFRSFNYTVNNGSIIRPLSASGVSSTATVLAVNQVLFLNKGDVMRFIFRQATGSTETASATVLMKKIGTAQGGEALTVTTTGEHWNLNISGGNPALSTLDVLSYAGISNASLALTIQPGSKPAKIGCLSSAAEGVHCTGATTTETLGVEIEASTAGRYRVCGKIIQNGRLGITNGCTSDTYLRWRRVAIDGLSILEEGTNPSSNAFSYNNSPAQVVKNFTHHLCEDFTIQPGPNRFEVAYIHDTVTNCTIVNQLLGDGLATSGDRDFKITIDKLDEQKPAPIYTGLNSTLATKLETFNGDEGGHFCSFSVSNTDTAPGVSNEFGGCVASISDIGTARFRVNFNAGLFPQTNYICDCMARQNSFPDHLCVNATRGSTTHDFITFDADNGNAQNSTVDIFCVGR